MRFLGTLMIALALRGAAAQRPAAGDRQRGQAAPHFVTGEQVEQILAEARGESDAREARRLYSLEPSARFDLATIRRCQGYLAGPKAKGAFTALADRSGFLDLQGSESSVRAAPDVAAQKQLLALTVAYVARTLHHLPNFYATRTTETFARGRRARKASMGLLARHAATVFYRDGGEVQRGGGVDKVVGLATRGEFGPILDTAMLDAAKGGVAWDRWEEEPSGLAAVFVYAVSKTDSHYKVNGAPASYRGEIAVDPASGSILRIVLKSELDTALGVFLSSGNILAVADIAVEYGPVSIGGKVYMCPVKGVALSESGDLLVVNDVEFADYHLFRGDMRMVTGFKDLR
jgi:hypothetical protein